MNNRLLILLIMNLILLTLQAQELTVKSMQTTNDLSASTYERKDLNGAPCALVKVQLPSLGVKFEGNVIEPVEYKTGEYWVYMSKGSRELRIKHPLTQPLHVKFIDYNIKSVESRATYNLSVQMPTIEEGVPMAKADDPQLPDWLNSQNPNQWVGISPPTTDRKKARSAAIINAVLGYLRANKEGRVTAVVNNETSNTNEKNIVKSLVKDKTACKVSYSGFSCEVTKEYYNARGEYFVLCGFVDNPRSKNVLQLQQNFSYEQHTKDDVAFHARTHIRLLVNNLQLSCTIETEPSNDGSTISKVTVNEEPLIPSVGMVYNKCQWAPVDEGSMLTFQPNEINQSLGVATLSAYCLLPFVPKALKCTGSIESNSISSGEETVSEILSHYQLKADTLCYPIPIHFMSLSNNKLTMRIGNANISERELEEEFVSSFDETVHNRLLEQCYTPFSADDESGAVIRMIKTQDSFINGMIAVAMKYKSQIDFNMSATDKTINSPAPEYRNLTNVNLQNIGIRWQFENLPTYEQSRKIERQFYKTKKLPKRLPGFYLVCEPKGQ